MYDFIMAYAEGHAEIAALYLMAITLGPIGLAAYHQNTLTAWSRSFWFLTSVVWAMAVLPDVSGLAPWTTPGLPQIALK